MSKTRFSVTEQDIEDVRELTGDTQTVSQFAKGAFHEKISRLKKSSFKSRRIQLAKDVEAMTPVLDEYFRIRGGKMKKHQLKGTVKITYSESLEILSAKMKELHGPEWAKDKHAVRQIKQAARKASRNG